MGVSVIRPEFLPNHCLEINCLHVSITNCPSFSNVSLPSELPCSSYFIGYDSYFRLSHQSVLCWYISSTVDLSIPLPACLLDFSINAFSYLHNSTSASSRLCPSPCVFLHVCEISYSSACLISFYTYVLLSAFFTSASLRLCFSVSLCACEYLCDCLLVFLNCLLPLSPSSCSQLKTKYGRIKTSRTINVSSHVTLTCLRFGFEAVVGHAGLVVLRRPDDPFINSFNWS